MNAGAAGGVLPRTWTRPTSTSRRSPTTFYEKVTFARLDAVLETLEYLRDSTDVWFEITTLLIPGHNDSDAEIAPECAWFAEHLGPGRAAALHGVPPGLQDARRAAHAAGDAAPGPADRPASTACGTSTPATCTTRTGRPRTARAAARPVVVRDWYDMLRLPARRRRSRARGCGTTLPGRFDGPVGTWGAPPPAGDRSRRSTSAVVTAASGRRRWPGAFYPADPAVSSPTSVDALLDAVRRAGRRRARAAAYVVPHAGYRYSGATAAHVYARLRRHADRDRPGRPARPGAPRAAGGLRRAGGGRLAHPARARSPIDAGAIARLVRDGHVAARRRPARAGALAGGAAAVPAAGAASPDVPVPTCRSRSATSSVDDVAGHAGRRRGARAPSCCAAPTCRTTSTRRRPTRRTPVPSGRCWSWRPSGSGRATPAACSPCAAWWLGRHGGPAAAPAAPAHLGRGHRRPVAGGRLRRVRLRAPGGRRGSRVDRMLSGSRRPGRRRAPARPRPTR